ncbi:MULTISPECIES: hypothetical protein [unclassified Maridesulfovibrio]|uniref:hypothetical protein n=1 Tax=unclassified Maridesulfovibrio TaxID=2794999 RepID=UPI003B43BC00
MIIKIFRRFFWTILSLLLCAYVVGQLEDLWIYNILILVILVGFFADYFFFVARIIGPEKLNSSRKVRIQALRDKFKTSFTLFLNFHFSCPKQNWYDKLIWPMGLGIFLVVLLVYIDANFTIPPAIRNILFG